MTGKIDFDSEEQGFRHELNIALEDIRRDAGPCPHPDLLMAAAAGVLSQSVDAVRKHVSQCPLCAQLTKDFAAYEQPGITEEEDRRIAARLAQEPRIPPRTISRRDRIAALWRPVPIAAAAIAAAGIIVGVLTLRQPVPNEPPPVAARPETPNPQTAAPTNARAVFLLEKAPIKIPASAVLTYRSAPNAGKAFLEDLASAFEPYRKDDYAEASRRFEMLAQRYPESPEAHFYLGVSRLLLNQNGAAMDSLSAARRTADETLRDDVSWYLALALERSARPSEAMGEFQTLCRGNGEYKDRACSAQKELEGRQE